MSTDWIALGSIVASALFWAGAAYAALRAARKDLNGIGGKLTQLQTRVQKQRYVLIVVLLAMAKSDEAFGSEYWEKMINVLEE